MSDRDRDFTASNGVKVSGGSDFLFIRDPDPSPSEARVMTIQEKKARALAEFFGAVNPPPLEDAKALYEQFYAEAVDSIQSQLFDDSGWSSEHYAREYHKFHPEATRIAERLFCEPIWALLGHAVRGEVD